MTAEKAERMYLAIIFIGGGSSWCNDWDKDKAVKTAVEICHRDWSTYFELSGKETFVCLFDMTGCTEGWFADCNGVYDRKAYNRLPQLEGVRTKFPDKKKRKVRA